MLRLVTGKPGAGKTYYAVEIARQAMLEGAIVHSNLPLKFDKVEELWPGQHIKLPGNPEKWIQPRPLQPGEDEDEVPRFKSDILVAGAEGRENLVIIDEASFNFGSTGQAKTGSQRARMQPVYDLLTLQRHFGLDIIFITQGKRKIDPQLRDEAAEFTHCQKAADLPFIGWIVAGVLRPFYGDFRRIYSGEGGGRVGVSWHKFRPEVGELYNTHSFRSDAAMRVDPTRKAKAAGTGSKGAVKTVVTLSLCLLAVGWAIWSTVGKLTGGKSLPPDNIAESPAAAPAAIPATAGPADAPLPFTVPASHRRGLVEVTWSEEDEWVIASTVNHSGGVSIRCRGGLRLQLGGWYMGEEITSVTHWRGWYYWTTEAGRVVVSRPAHPVERFQWWTEYKATLQPKEQPKENKAADVLDAAATGAASTLGL